MSTDDPEDGYANDDRESVVAEDVAARLAERDNPMARLRRLVADDEWAAAFETVEDYRAALLKVVDAIAPELAADRVTKTLQKVRACIMVDRTALAETHFDHGLGRVDEYGQAGLDEYDQVLAAIDALLPSEAKVVGG